jgi:hypothetical protein
MPAEGNNAVRDHRYAARSQQEIGSAIVCLYDRGFRLFSIRDIPTPDSGPEYLVTGYRNREEMNAVPREVFV